MANFLVVAWSNFGGFCGGFSWSWKEESPSKSIRNGSSNNWQNGQNENRDKTRIGKSLYCVLSLLHCEATAIPSIPAALSTVSLRARTVARQTSRRHFLSHFAATGTPFLLKTLDFDSCSYRAVFLSVSCQHAITTRPRLRIRQNTVARDSSDRDPRPSDPVPLPGLVRLREFSKRQTTTWIRWISSSGSGTWSWSGNYDDRQSSSEGGIKV